MRRINVHLTILIALSALWLGATGRQVEAHESAAVAHPQVESLTDSVIATWRQKVKQHPRDAQARINLGDTLMQRARETGDLGYYPRAQSAFQTALRFNPKSSAAMTGRAWVHGALHQFEASIQWANKAIAIDPEASDAYGLLGDAAVEMGDNDAAFGHYQKMLDIRPNLASYSRGAHLLFVTGDIQAAIALMRKAIAAGAPFAENTAWCRAELARMLLSQGALQEAEQIIRKGLQQTPQNFHLLAVKNQVKSARK